MKVLAVIGKEQPVEEEIRTDRGWVKNVILKNDPVGAAIRKIILGNGDRRRLTMERHQTVCVRECDTAEQINTIRRSSYRPDLVVIAQNTRIRVTAEDMDRLELEHFGCPVVIIVAPDKPCPASPQYDVITWDNHETASARLKAIMDQTADAVNEREQRERKAQWEAGKKADAEALQKANEKTDEEWAEEGRKYKKRQGDIPTKDDQ
jgi:hypothetical protein